MISGIAGFAYDCKDADALSDFYVKLLGWEKILSGNGWAGLRSPQGWIFSQPRSEEHTSELQSLPRNSYAVFCLKKKIALLRCFSSGGSPHMPMDSAYVTWTFLHVFFFLMIRRPPRSTPL